MVIMAIPTTSSKKGEGIGTWGGGVTEGVISRVRVPGPNTSVHVCPAGQLQPVKSIAEKFPDSLPNIRNVKSSPVPGCS
jgi:hypothetical protein